MEENKDLNVAVPSPTDTTPVAAPVVNQTEQIVTEVPVAPVEPAPVAPIEPTLVVIPESVPTPPELEQEGTGDTITFDYNQLYQNQQAAPQQEQTAVVEQSTTLQETPIILENEQTAVEPTPVVKDIVPTFDTTALEDDLPDELKPKVEEPLIHTLATDAQKERQESNTNIMFIVVFFAVLIIAVLIIFPLMLGI